MRPFILILACTLVALAPLRPVIIGATSALTAAQPTLSDLKAVDELKGLFNRDAGKVRLVLLVSPT